MRHATDDGLLVRFADGASTANAQVLLATGLEPAPDHPLVSQAAETLGLERGANGFPVLNDRTLAWRRIDGTDSRIYVAGKLAETAVGPLARNIVGARRVAERLLASCLDSRDSAGPQLDLHTPLEGMSVIIALCVLSAALML